MRRRIGFLPESPRLYEDMTGIEFLEYVGRLQTGGDAPDWKPFCERLDLRPEALARKIKGYSNGMKQKIALVQALQHRPSLLILDEPTSALDPISQQAFFELLRDARAGGATILFSSHNLWEVEQLCHRVAIVRQGVVVESGRVDELQERRARVVEVVFRTARRRSWTCRARRWSPATAPAGSSASAGTPTPSSARWRSTTLTTSSWSTRGSRTSSWTTTSSSRRKRARRSENARPPCGRVACHGSGPLSRNGLGEQ